MSTQLKTCFNGCSYTVGLGFPPEQRHNYIYDRLLQKKYSFKLDNIAMGGSSNHIIFLKSCQAVLSGKYDIVFSQWSALNRLWLCPGPGSTFFTNDDDIPEFRYREIYLSKKEKNRFRSHLLMLNHDYQNILDLINYCNILIRLAQNSGTEVVFINGLLPWCSDLDKETSGYLQQNLSEYTKQMLDFDNRDDDEILKFFLALQEKFSLLDKSKWVNIFDSFQNACVDKGPEGHHPGIKSHQWMAEMTAKYLENNQLI